MSAVPSSKTHPLTIIPTTRTYTSKLPGDGIVVKMVRDLISTWTCNKSIKTDVCFYKGRTGFYYWRVIGVHKLMLKTIKYKLRRFIPQVCVELKCIKSPVDCKHYSYLIIGVHPDLGKLHSGN